MLIKTKLIFNDLNDSDPLYNEYLIFFYSLHSYLAVKM